ncbi:unnamed protein product, partial [Aphanomyces euteiches]
HHCRLCGGLFCAECTDFKAVIPTLEGRSTVCRRCFRNAQVGDYYSIVSLVTLLTQQPGSVPEKVERLRALAVAFTSARKEVDSSMGTEIIAQLNDLNSIGGISVFFNMLQNTEPQDVLIHLLMVLANCLALYNVAGKPQAAEAFAQSKACQQLVLCLGSGVEDLELQALRTAFHLCKSTSTACQDALRAAGATAHLCEILASDASTQVKIDASKCIHVYILNNDACRDEVVGNNGLSVLVQTLLLVASSPDPEMDLLIQTMLLCLESEFLQQYPIERLLIAPLFVALQPHFSSVPTIFDLLDALVTDHMRYATVLAAQNNVMESLILCFDQPDSIAAAALRVVSLICCADNAQPAVLQAVIQANGLIQTLQWMSKCASSVPLIGDIEVHKNLLMVLSAFCTEEYVSIVLGYHGTSVLLAFFTYEPKVLELSARALVRLIQASPSVLNEVVPFGAGEGFEAILQDAQASQSCKESSLIFFGLMGAHSTDIIISALATQALFSLAADKKYQKLALASVCNLTGLNRSSHRLILQQQVVTKLYESVLNPLLRFGVRDDPDILSLALQCVQNVAHIPTLMDQGVLKALLACIERNDFAILTWDVILQCVHCASSTSWNDSETIQALYTNILKFVINQPSTDSVALLTVLHIFELCFTHSLWKYIFMGQILQRKPLFIDFCEALAERLDRLFSSRPSEAKSILSICRTLSSVRSAVPLMLQADLHASLLNGLKNDAYADEVLVSMQAFLRHENFQSAVFKNQACFNRLVELYAQDNGAAGEILCALAKRKDEFPISNVFISSLIQQLETSINVALSEQILSHLTDADFANNLIWIHIIETRNLRIVNQIINVAAHDCVLIAAIACGQHVVQDLTPDAQSFRDTLLHVLETATRQSVRTTVVVALSTMVQASRALFAHGRSVFEPPFDRALLSSVTSEPLAVANLLQFANEAQWDLSSFWATVSEFNMRAVFVETLSNVHPVQDSVAIALKHFIVAKKPLKTREVNTFFNLATNLPNIVKSTDNRGVWLDLMRELSLVSRLAQALIDGNGIECVMENLAQFDVCQSILINLAHYPAASQRLLNCHGVSRLLALVEANRNNPSTLMDLLNILNTLSQMEKPFRVAISGSLGLWRQLLVESTQECNVPVTQVVVKVLASLCELQEIRQQVVVLDEVFSELYLWLGHVCSLSDDFPSDLVINALILIQHRIIAQASASDKSFLDLLIDLTARQRDSLTQGNVVICQTLSIMWGSKRFPHDDSRWRTVMENLSSSFLARSSSSSASREVQSAMLPLALEMGSLRSVNFPNELMQWLVISALDAENALVLPLMLQLCSTSNSFLLFLRSQTRVIGLLRANPDPLAQHVYLLLGQDVISTQVLQASNSMHVDEDENEESSPNLDIGYVEQEVVASQEATSSSVEVEDNYESFIPPNTTSYGTPALLPTPPPAPLSASSAPAPTSYNSYDSPNGAYYASSNSAPQSAASYNDMFPQETVNEISVQCRHCTMTVNLPVGVSAYLDTIPCPHCNTSLGSAPQQDSSTKTVSCTQCRRPLHLPEGLDLPEVMCPYCNAVNKFNAPAPPPTPPPRTKTMKCGYCAHAFSAPTGQPTIQCPRCSNISRVDGFDSMEKVNCASCGTLLALPRGVKSYKCMKCAHIQK